VATYVAVFALVLAYVALVAAYCALRTLAKLRRSTALLSRGTQGGQRQQSIIEATTHQAELTADVADQLEALRLHVDDQQQTFLAAIAEQAALAAIAERAAAAERAGDESGALRKVALVRYDAFADVAGRMSFSLAVLDDRGDGVTLSAISGRSDTRMYAKSVVGGVGEHELSPEERQAVSAALGKSRGLLGRRAS
jgi:hypothetical protein